MRDPWLSLARLSSWKKGYHYEILNIWLDLIPFDSFDGNRRGQRLAHESRLDRWKYWSLSDGVEIFDYYTQLLRINRSHFDQWLDSLPCGILRYSCLWTCESLERGDRLLATNRGDSPESGRQIAVSVTCSHS